MEKYVFIYNLDQAYFYIRNGVNPVYIDKHERTKNVYFQFIKDATNSLYTEWLNRNKQ